MKNIFILLITCVFTLSAKAHYGPRGLFGGDVICGTHHNGTVYLGTAEGGVYMSANVQLTGWRVRNVGLKSGLVTDLYHNGNFIFVSTSNEGVFIFNGSAGGNDLFWNDRNTGLIHKNVSALGGIKNTTILYAGTSGNGLYTSTDEGVTWSNVNHPFFNNKHITSIEELNGRIVVATNDAGVFYTDDNINWTDFNDLNTAGLGVLSLSYNPYTDEMVLVNPIGIFILSSASSTLTPNYSDSEIGLPISIEIRNVSNNGLNWYLATNQGVYHADALQPVEWTAINTGLTQFDTHVVVALQDDLILGTQEEGVFKSSTLNYDWASNNIGTHGITNIRVHSVAGLGDTVTATATEKGIAISMESGINPLLRNNGLTDYLNVNDLVFAGDFLVAGTQNAGVFITEDLGLNWQAINTGLLTPSIKKVFYSNGNIYAIGDNGKIYKSSLSTINWVEYMTGIPDDLQVTSMTFYSNWLYAGTYGGGVYAKTLSELSWSAFNECPCGCYSLGNLNVTSLTASAGMLYAGTDGSGVYSCSYDNSNWMETNPIAIPHFDDVTFLQPQFIQNMTSFGGFVFASYRGGIVATKDGGQTWVRGGHQFNIPSFSDVNKISFITDRIMITTQNNNMMSNSVNEFNTIDDTLHVASVFETIPASGGNTYHSLTTNLAWEITNISDSWIQVGNMAGFRNGVVDIFVDENVSAETRSGTVTVSAGTFSEVITINQLGTLSLPSLENKPVLLMYPNPSNGEFAVVSENQMIKAIKVFNSMGQEVYFFDGYNSQKVILDGLNCIGVYTVEIITLESVSTLKMVIR
jgi:photosystem II stability/assembly factor-like uncharacterized protein